MQDFDANKEIQQKIKLLQVILFFILSAAIILGLVPHFNLLPAMPEKLELNVPLKEIFYVLATMSVITGTILKKLLFNAKTKKNTAINANDKFKAFMIAQIVSFTLYESVSIFGFIIFMLTGDLESSMLFTFISVAAMLLQWPKEKELLTSLTSSHHA